MRWYALFHLLPPAAQAVVTALCGIGLMVAAAASFVLRRSGRTVALMLLGGVLILWAGIEGGKTVASHPEERDLLVTYAARLAERAGVAAGGGLREARVAGIEVEDKPGANGQLYGRILLHLVDARDAATDVPVRATWDPEYRTWSAPAEFDLNGVEADGSADAVRAALRGEVWHRPGRGGGPR